LKLDICEEVFTAINMTSPFVKACNEIPGLTVSALGELDTAHCEPGVKGNKLSW